MLATTTGRCIWSSRHFSKFTSKLNSLVYSTCILTCNSHKSPEMISSISFINFFCVFLMVWMFKIAQCDALFVSHLFRSDFLQYARNQSSDETDAHLNTNGKIDQLEINPKRFTLWEYVARTVAHTKRTDTHENINSKK